MRLATCLTIGMFLGISAYGETWIVDDDGKADFDNINLAVAAASDGDVILVMEGTYYGSYINPHGKAILVEGQLDEKGQHLVTVDGMQSGAILEFYSGEGPDTVFRNLLLTNGSSYYGGGATLFNGSSPSIENCIFIANLGTIEGGGIYLRENCNPIISDCRFESNFALGPGGGMFCMENSSPTLTNCVFDHNASNQHGGGMYIYTGAASLTGCLFIDNTAAYGGGVYSSNSNADFSHSAITNNYATYGGGVYSSGGGGTPTFSSTIIEGNGAGNYGGGLFCDYYSNPYLSQCSISNNTASSGGGMQCEVGSDPYLFECTVSGNQVAYDGGGLFCSDSSPVITDCTIANNVATQGGGLWCSYVSVPLVSGTQICGNTPNQIFGTWDDLGGNTVADVCQDQCPADVTQDGEVNVSDLLAVIAAWGPCPDCDEDVDANGTVDVTDLLEVIGNWGPCS